MSKKTRAPRRKSHRAQLAREMRGTKLSCARRVTNAEKWSVLEPLFSRVMALKQKMSAYVHANLLACVLDPYTLKSHYKKFSSRDLNAWERQALFHDIVGDYQRALGQRLKAAPFRLQNGWSCQRYQRAVIRVLNDGARVPLHPAGGVKAGTFSLRYRHSPLTKLANYLMRVDVARFDANALKNDHKLKADFLRVAADPAKWSRLLALVEARRARLLARQKPIHYVTGTFRVNPKESHTRVLIDESNAEHKLWLELRLGVEKKSATFVRLPLQVNEARLRKIAAGDIAQLALTTELRLKFTQHKLHVCTVYEALEPVFLPENGHRALDLNTKRSFATDDTGRTYELDALVLEAGLALLARIDAEGGVSKMGYRRAAQLRQWLRRNEAGIKKRLAAWCDEWVAAGVTDVWLEDLAMSGDATFLRHPTLDAQKYSRVLRLMRLSAVKQWLLSIGEKRGVRVHTTDAAYSSQECPRCHHIERANRPAQALFHCVACHFEADADHVAAQNLVNRGMPALRGLLHVEDRHGRCSPAPLRRTALKAHLAAQAASAGGVTELPTPALSTKRDTAAVWRRSSGSSTHSAA